MFITLNYRRIQLQASLPEGWQDIHIPGTVALSWKGKEGVILVEQVGIGHNQLYFIRVFFHGLERIELRLSPLAPILILPIEGSWTVVLKGGAKMVFKAHQFNILFSDQLQVVHETLGGRMAQLLYLFVDLTLLDTSAFPLFPIGVSASPAMLDMVIQLIQTSYFPRPRKFHESLVQDLLQQVSSLQSTPISNPNRYHNSDLEAIRAIALIIDRSPAKHYTIAELTRLSGLNRQKMMLGFKSIFGKTVYAYHLEKRMALAKSLLLTSGQPLKRIAQLSGYRNATNFSIAFKKFYQLTPGAMRKQPRD